MNVCMMQISRHFLQDTETVLTRILFQLLLLSLKQTIDCRDEISKGEI